MEKGVRHVHTTQCQALTLVCENPSPKRIISAIMAESGTIMEMGRNMLFKLSGSSVRPAYPLRKRERDKGRGREITGKEKNERKRDKPGEK